ncbi:MAG: hypothetical protein JXN10_11600 [Clostridia bacterium]|nr:hypothetical protein [Clostridia bacterium]MBN2884165.1 hypothetical protein [Clostridia bacterium]
MKKYKEIAAVILLIVLVISAGAYAVITFPITARADNTPIITIPVITMPSITFPPDLIPSPDRFREISTETGAGNFSDTYPRGMDYGMNDILAVGAYDTAAYEIRFFDGKSWISREVDFRPYLLEWEPDYTPLLYATDGLNIYVSSNPTAELPVWSQITSNEDEASFRGMYVNSSGTLYVVDALNTQIQYYKNSEWKTMSFPDITGALTDITAIGFDYYVTDYYNSCIWHRNFLGQWNKIEDEDYIKNPTFIDSDSEGNLYFISYAKNSEGENKKAIVKYEGGSFSIFVPGGDGVGYISNSFPVWDELCINHHDRLFYSDMASRMIIKEKDDINEIISVEINGAGLQLMEGWTQANWTVEPEIETAEILASPWCPYSTIEGLGTFPLEFGENYFPLVCIPETGTSKEYTILIIREISDNPLLSDISIDSVLIDGFNPNIFAYTGINFPYDKESIELSATPQDSNAIVTGTGTLNIDVGYNLFVISVIAQDEVTDQQYIIAVNRAEAPATPTPAPSPTSTPDSTPSPTPASSSTPTPTPIPTSSSTPSPTPTATGTTEPTPTPSTEPSTEPTPTPSSSATPDSEPSKSPEPGSTQTLTPSSTPNPGTDSEDNIDVSFGTWINEHPGIAATAGVVAGGTLILVAYQLSKKGKKKKAGKSPE